MVSTYIRASLRLHEKTVRILDLLAERTFIDTVLDGQGRLVRFHRAVETVHGPQLRQWAGIRQ